MDPQAGRFVSRDEDLEAEKKLLERRAAKARGSITATVSEIKETVGSRVRGVKESIDRVSDFRDHFAKEPVVWSLGTLAAGFALGYSLGYAHRLTKRGGSRAGRLSAFASAVAEELTTVGNTLVMPRLDANVKQLFGVDLSSLLAEMKRPKRPRRKTKAAVSRIKRTSNRTKSTPASPRLRTRRS